MLMDASDAGKITVKIIKDEDTLNKEVIAYGEIRSQNEIHKIMENKTGEGLELSAVRWSFLVSSTNPDEKANRCLMAAAQYAITKYVRADNAPENAKYSGYISTNELFLEFKYKSYVELVDEPLAGKVKRPYPHIEV